MATELFQYTVTFSNGFYRIFELNNNNLLIQFPVAQDVIAVDPNNLNYFTIGTSGNRITLDYTLCSNLPNPSRQALMDNIVALATTSITVSIPSASDIVGASRTTTGTLVTIPAGRVFYGQVSLSASISVAGNCQPTISVTAGTGVAPTGVIHMIGVVGLALTVASNANTMGNVYIHGGQVGAPVVFIAGASGSSSGQITGRLL